MVRCLLERPDPIWDVPRPGPLGGEGHSERVLHVACVL